MVRLPLEPTAWAFAVLVLLAADAGAQVIAAPSRSENPQTAAGSSELHQTLTMSASATGGWDQDETAGLLGGVGGDVATSGYTAFVDGSLAYARTRGARGYGLTGRGFVTGYPGSDVQNGVGGDVGARSDLGFGRNRLGLVGTLRYEPFFSLGAFAPVQGEAGGASPDTTPTNALGVDQNNWTYEAGATLGRTWNIRQSTNSGYTYTKRNRHGQDRLGSDIEGQLFQFGHSVALGRVAGIGASYTFARSSFFEPSAVVQDGRLSTHAIEMTVNVLRRLTRTRRLSLLMGGGAQRAAGESGGAVGNYVYWNPSALASFRVDIGREWALTADYRRATAVLDSVSLQPFASDTVLLRAGGNFGRMMNAAVSAGYAGGQSGAIGESGRYTNYTAGVQIGFILSRCCSTVLSYSYYSYRLADLADTPAILPRDFNRSAVRGGMTISLPLVPWRGATAQPRGRGGRR